MIRSIPMAVGICCLVAGLPPAWAVQKCVGQDGKVSYQEAPCASTAKSAEAVKLDPVPPTTPLDSKINAAIATSSIVVGMTAAQVRRSWGSPSKINRTVGSYGANEQWVYQRENYQAQYVYLENGVVTSIQSPN